MKLMHLSDRSLLRRSVVIALSVALLCGVMPAHAQTLDRELTLTGPANPTVSEATTFGGRFTESGLGIPLISVELKLDGVVKATTVTGLDGSYQAAITISTYGQHAVQAKAGNGTLLDTDSPVLMVEALPPLDETVATDVHNSSKFIYEGDAPAQTGVATGTIEPERAALLRGNVIDRQGLPIEGVKVTIPGHSEFGQTLSTDEGNIDLVVNGGSELVVRYEKAGFITVEREVATSWQDYSNLPEVVLVPYDSQSTTVTLSSTTTSVQVARGSVATDTAGTRQATLLFPAGTRGTLTFPNGDTSTLTSGKLRATELTVGAAGPNSMPAALPPESAYTYAVELSFDEAVSAGATKVNFTKAVPFYVENFLGFPIGTPVPVGYYDRELHSWVPEPNGRVIKILSITAGKADLDVDGDGTADTGSVLSSLGINDAEREKLATLYSSGTSLWRAPLTHFSPLDLNFPPGLPPGAQGPNVGEGKGDASGQCERSGSIIGCENQTLGEAIPIAGTPFHLRYDTSRVPGRKATNSLRIPLSSATLPANLKRIDLTVNVAGRRFSYSFDPPTANLHHTFTWDGKDVFGRLVQGAQTATVRIGYVYQAVYVFPASVGRAFGLPGTEPFTIPARNEMVLSQSYEKEIGSLFNSGLNAIGGWTLSSHHSYDSKSGTLYLGDGSSRAAEAVFPAISTFAGTGAAGSNGDGTYTGDGGAAISAGLSQAEGLAMGPDGTLYIADTGNAVIRRVTTDGVINRFAGGGNPPSGNGDGGPATSAELGFPTDLAVGPDGSVYIVDAGDLRVRKVSPSGTISTFAGGGFPDDGIGDGGPATSAAFSGPNGIAIGRSGTVFVADLGHDRVRRISRDGYISTAAGGGSPADNLGDGGAATAAKLFNPHDVAVAPDGTLFIADTDHDRVRKVLPDGRISTIAGTGIAGSAGDDGPATSAQLSAPVSLAFSDEDASLYIVQRIQPRVRVVVSDGIIRTVIGTGTAGFSGDKGAPARAQLNHPQGVAIGSDGRLYVADSGNFRIRRILPSVQGFSTTDFMVPSPGGAEIFHFNASGRHLRTLEALTGAVIHTFNYDTSGRLTSVEDDFTNVTTIERDTSGSPTAIVSPFGLRTSLTVTSGYLTAVTNPANETVDLGYGTDGLLTSLTTPRDHTYTFTYDSLGRLTKDEGPDGSFTALDRIDTPDGFRVTATSAEGRATLYEVESGSDGSSRRTIVYSSGVRTEATTSLDGTLRVTSADGMTSTTTFGPDPRWGFQAAIPSTTTVSTPGGKTITTTAQRTATFSDPTNPLTLTSQTESMTSNAKTVSRSFNKAALTLTSTSAEGRLGVITLNSQAQVTKVKEANVTATTFDYDARGRLVTTTVGSGPNARVTTLAYDSNGFVSSVNDPLHETEFTHDEVGRVLTSILPDTEEVSFAYDDNGNLSSLTPPEGTSHGFDYTKADLGEKYRPPTLDTQVDYSTSFSYNRDHQVTQTALPGSRLVGSAYDTTGRPSTTTFNRGSMTYTYNSSSQLSSIDAPGGEVLRYSYDGQLLTSQSSEGTVSGTVTYGYNFDLLPSSRSINGGTATSYTYNKDGLVTNAGGMSLAWDATNGYLNSTNLGSVSTAFTYSAFAEAATLSASFSAAQKYGAVFERDKIGRITKKTETVEGVTHVFDYVYDSRGRLEEVKKDTVSQAQYSYDANSNRTEVITPSGSVTATYDAQDRLLTYGANTYTFEPNGDLKTKSGPAGTTTYVYDDLGNLTKVTLPNGTVIDYVIDGAGRRIAKKVNGSIERKFLYGSGIAPVAELDANGNVVSTFTYATRSNVPDHMTKGGATYRIVTDHLGSPRQVINTSTGEIVQRLDFDTFGVVTQDTNPGFQPFGFAGGLYDPATELVRFGARDYDAETGRWTAKDPIGFEGGDTNLYSYVGNDPVNHYDPTGEIAFLVLIPIIWGVIEVGLAIADGISTASTLMDDCASDAEKMKSLGLFALGLALPAGGGSTALRHGDEVVQIIRGARATAHGAERLSGWTDEALELTLSGKKLNQADGATVYLKEVSPGRYNFIVDNPAGEGVITAQKNWPLEKVKKIAENYGWNWTP